MSKVWGVVWQQHVLLSSFSKVDELVTFQLFVPSFIGKKTEGIFELNFGPFHGC